MLVPVLVDGPAYAGAGWCRLGGCLSTLSSGRRAGARQPHEVLGGPNLKIAPGTSHG